MKCILDAKIRADNTQFNPYPETIFILVYQNHRTKFVLLQFLHNKTTQEVANRVLYGFTSSGVPNNHYCENNEEFKTKLLKK